MHSAKLSTKSKPLEKNQKKIKQLYLYVLLDMVRFYRSKTLDCCSTDVSTTITQKKTKD